MTKPTHLILILVLIYVDSYNKSQVNIFDFFTLQIDIPFGILYLKKPIITFSGVWSQPVQTNVKIL